MKEALMKKVEELSDQMIEDILQVVKIDSVQSEATHGKPFGEGVAKALNMALQIAERLGFTTRNIDGYMGYAQYGEGEDYIGVVGHLDVVPVNEGWTHPPFSGYENEEGRIFARGILDNKGPIMSCLYALYAIKECQISLDKPVRIIFGTNEETGFADIAYYLTKEKPPVMGWTPDCKYPVVYGERGRASIKISADHAYQKAFIAFVNTYFLQSKNNGDRLGINYEDQAFGSMQMSGYHLGHEDHEVSFYASLSYPYGISIDEIMDRIKAKADETIRIELLKNYHPVKFEKDCFMVKSLQEAYEEVTGLDGTPVTTTGGTYAKIMPNIVPFGPSFPGQKGIGHHADEWMDRKDLITNAKIYALALYKLGQSEAKRVVEICCGSYYDAYQAYLGGAKRVELNSALHLGGLTPSVGALTLTKKHTDVKVITMIRPRAAGFCYNEIDFETMLEDTKLMLAHGADGIAFGCLDETGEIAVEQCKAIIQIVKEAGKEVVFHRAFDCTSDPYTAIETLISLGVDRILTSGLQPKAMQGKALIKELQERYGDRITLLAGSGMNESNAKEMLDDTGISQVHSSCKDWLSDPTTTIGNVSYAVLSDEHENDFDVVDKDKVRAFVKSIQ